MPPVVNLEQRSIMKRTETIKGQYAYKTDLGRVRITNEDQALVLTCSAGYVLMCVCDGMGGHNKGDYASKLAIDTVAEEFRKLGHFRTAVGIRTWITRTIRKANNIIHNEAQTAPEYKDMGTTLVMAILVKDMIYTVNVGDSRAYAVRYAGLKQLTEDQTYVDYLYRTGKISEQEMDTSENRHILMNALGTFPSVSFDIKVYANIKNPILLCSDGLYNNASEKEIHRALSTNETVEQKIDTLIGIANSNGGSDNIGIAYWEAIK